MPSLGIDQGGSKTVAIVADEDGQLLAKGLAAGACHFYDGMEKAMGSVRIAADIAMAQAGVAPKDVRSVCAGMAGANWPEEIASLESGLRVTLSMDDVSVYNDCLIAMRGGTARVPCAVICAGTGLNVALGTFDGSTRVYNNYVEDVDQGARGLGMRTLQALFLSEIGFLPPTTLTTRVLAHFGLDEVDRLLLAYQRQQLAKPLATVSPILFEAAGQSDPLALGVIRDFGASVSRYVVAGIRKSGLTDAGIDVVLSGGIFKAGNRVLVQTIGEAIHAIAPRADIVEALYEPVVGAALLALDARHGASLPPAVMARCRTSAEALGLLRVTSAAGLARA